MYKAHNVVVLRQDLPGYGLSRGEVGAIVGVYGKGGYEVELAGQGGTVAVVTLSDEELRPLGRREIFTVRELSRLAG